MLDDTIDAVRQISRDLMPATLEKFGLGTAVRELAERLQATAHIQIGVVEMGTRTTTLLSRSQELMLFRIVQELLNNAIKHAQATYIEVVLAYGEGVQLSVEDNGVGLTREQRARSGLGSLGLFNVESRLQLLGANLAVEEQKTDGCKITVTLPPPHGS
jgi:signal transduction histidine kinase